MSLLTTYPFDTPGNYIYDSDKIEVTGGKAQLKLINLPNLQFIEDFEDDTGFAYDSDKAEFVGGKVQQKDQRPGSNATFGANYDTDIDGNWGNGVLTGTPTGGAAVLSGKLDLAHNDTRYVDYNADLNADNQQTGCIRFKVTPNYTGGPPSIHYFFDIGANSLKNKITFYQIPDKTTYLTIHNNTNGRILIIGGGIWNTIAGQEYEIEIDFDVTTGATRLFIDGVQQGSTATGTGTRDSDITDLRIGSARGSTCNSNYSIDDFVIFSTVQHTANYTPGYTVPDILYVASTVTLPEMVYTGPGTLVAVVSFITIESGVPRYTIQMDRSGDDLYWDGSDWVASDGTYAQASDAVTANAHAPAVQVVGSLYGQFKTYFPDSNTMSDVDNTIVTLTGQSYPTDNQTIKPVSAVRTDGIESYAETVTKAGSDDIKNVIEVSGQNKYWNGSSWIDSAGYAQSNSADDSNDNAAGLDIAVGVELRVVWYLHSETGMTTPILDLATLGYDFFGPTDPKPLTCEVYGYVIDKATQDKENITIEVEPKRAQVVKDANFLMDGQSSTITTNSVGYFEKELIRSSAFNPAMGYRFMFRNAQGKLLFDRTVKTPDLLNCAFDDLEDI